MRSGHSTNGTHNGIARPIQIANRIDVAAATTPAAIAMNGTTPVMHAVIAAFARPSTSRRNTVWRSVIAWMLKTTEKPSPTSCCATSKPSTIACEPRASGMHRPLSDTNTDAITIVHPTPKELASLRARPAPMIEPTPPIAMITPNVACDSPRVRKQNSV